MHVSNRSTGTAETCVRFKTFPKYLTIQARRYVFDENYQPKKLDAIVTFPEELDLESLRGYVCSPLVSVKLFTLLARVLDLN